MYALAEGKITTLHRQWFKTYRRYAVVNLVQYTFYCIWIAPLRLVRSKVSISIHGMKCNALQSKRAEVLRKGWHSEVLPITFFLFHFWLDTRNNSLSVLGCAGYCSVWMIVCIMYWSNTGKELFIANYLFHF